jgi:hypothetical protein
MTSSVRMILLLAASAPAGNGPWLQMPERVEGHARVYITATDSDGSPVGARPTVNPRRPPRADGEHS